MDRRKLVLIGINLLGGSAVLASYAHGLLSHPGLRAAVWGELPESLRPLYTVSMLLATLGYFTFTGFWLRVDARSTRIAGRLGLGAINGLYGVVLLCSALWMPLTFAMLEQPSAALWLAIRVDLALVGLGSLGLLTALLALRPAVHVGARRAALAGCAAFCFQTALLDAVVWPAFFPA